MKMWQKVAIGVAVVVVGAGIVLYSVNQASVAQEAMMMRIMLSSIAPQEK